MTSHTSKHPFTRGHTGTQVMIVAHPMLGALLVFEDYDQGYAVSDDIGNDWDISPFGYLKSRGHIVHTDDSWPVCHD